MVIILINKNKVLKKLDKKNNDIVYNKVNIILENNKIVETRQVDVLIEVLRNRIAENRFSFVELSIGLVSAFLTSVIIPFFNPRMEKNGFQGMFCLMVAYMCLIFIAYFISYSLHERRGRNNRVMSCFIEDLYILKNTTGNGEDSKNSLSTDSSNTVCRNIFLSDSLRDFTTLIGYVYSDRINRNPVKKDIESTRTHWDPTVAANNTGKNDYSSFVGKYNVSPDVKNIEDLANTIMPYLLKEKNAKMDAENRRAKYGTIELISIMVAALAACCVAFFIFLKYR